MSQSVSCLTRRVCYCDFERLERKKHSNVALGSDLNGVRQNIAAGTLVNTNLLLTSFALQGRVVDCDNLRTIL